MASVESLKSKNFMGVQNNVNFHTDFIIAIASLLVVNVIVI